MSPQLAYAILSVLIVGAVLSILWMLSSDTRTPDPILSAFSASDKDFRAYVRHELAKAQAGAVNAETWAVELLQQWERKNGKR